MRKNDTVARKEHEVIRQGVGYYDFTHSVMEVSGKGAPAFLDKMFVNNIGTSKIGQAVYTTMLNESGIIIDDVIIFRLEDELFWVSTLYIDEMFKWFDNYKSDFDVNLKNITDDWTMYAVQGPKSAAVLNDLLKNKVDDMAFLTIEDNEVDGTPVKIARSGYTGELGYELYCKSDIKKEIEEKLVEKGKAYDMMNITTDVIVTSLPREAGYVLMSDIAGTNPIEAGYGWTIRWAKDDFIGKAALEKVKDQKPARSLIGFTVADDAAEIEPGTAVMKDGAEVGKVTMFTYGFTVEKNIGFALIENDKAAIGDKATIGDYEAELSDRVFYASRSAE
ncbi:MAG: aminomethyl transferase family protein [Eubacteriaceae bacterium]|jgi:aminomethyltransferase|nr:aminomethyl transferase family protein [Eubacteriaceae bacterium]